LLRCRRAAEGGGCSTHWLPDKARAGGRADWLTGWLAGSMSMGLYEKYEFPHMYTSPELNAATTKLIYNARKNGKILGLFLFGTDRVKEFLDKGFTFISVRLANAPPPFIGPSLPRAAARPRLCRACLRAAHAVCCVVSPWHPQLGNDLHHGLTQGCKYLSAVEDIPTCSWKHKPSGLNP
jgi:hypothetical protein